MQNITEIIENTLNSCIALLLDGYAKISAQAEPHTRNEAIEITVTHECSTADLRVFIEAQIGTTTVKRRLAAGQALYRLSTQPDALAFALCYPRHL